MNSDNVEIERKFLVANDDWRPDASSTRLRQGYLCVGEVATVRVRIGGGEAWLTIKGPTRGLSRTEAEYAITVTEAEAMLEYAAASSIIDKTRHVIRHGDHLWEIDEFHGDNEGLIVAEVELTREDEQPQLPDWVGTEVSHDPRYRNASLATNPYRDWDAPATAD
jgi:adenylate cyclase